MQELRSRGISPKQALGQHFLIDQGIAQKIVRLATLEPEDCVVEIGPGMGVLTFLMLPLVKKVIAVELDPGMADYLKEKAQGMASLIIIRQDALGFDFSTAAKAADRRLKVVANLPYNISTPVIFRLLESRLFFSHLTLMLQREVAQRISASPGNKEYGPLSIFIQLYTSPKIMMRVPPEAFYPSPKVESALVGFEILERPRIAIGDDGFFQKVVRASFAQRRKTLLNALKNSPLALGSGKEIEAALVAAGIDPRRRAETLDLIEFQRLAEALHEV
ncbi:MAG: ribosomal RNA small subunit methyltransferase A [Deltaproteobacteria bacterium RBG_16_54_11]|nr:MAG: ribosomal RNA small subunit methyltransferase A [Deltaproteobacteria bacterium RBG_16_54_11]